MKRIVLKKINWVIGALIGLFGIGISGCNEEHECVEKYGVPIIEEDSVINVMYGVPDPEIGTVER